MNLNDILNLDIENLSNKQYEGEIMNQYKNKTLEELLEIRNELVEAWIIQKSDYQVKQLKKVNYEIEKRKENDYEIRSRNVCKN